MNKGNVFAFLLTCVYVKRNANGMICKAMFVFVCVCVCVCVPVCNKVPCSNCRRKAPLLLFAAWRGKCTRTTALCLSAFRTVADKQANSDWAHRLMNGVVEQSPRMQRVKETRHTTGVPKGIGGIKIGI